MGNWNINIQGIGVHHNSQANNGKGLDADANKMFQEFVEKLKKVGHTIEHATFTFGGKEIAEDES